MNVKRFTETIKNLFYMLIEIPLVSAAWNGPFSLGPLSKPVSPMDALMKILELAWKSGFIYLFFCIAWFLIGIAFMIFGATIYVIAKGIFYGAQYLFTINW